MESKVTTMGSTGIARGDDMIVVGIPPEVLGKKITYQPVTLNLAKLTELAEEARGNQQRLVLVGQVIIDL